MADDRETKLALLRQLGPTHARFAVLMEARMRDAELEDVERYAAMIGTLVSKLEDDDKALREVLREMAAEYAALVLMELNR